VLLVLKAIRAFQDIVVFQAIAALAVNQALVVTAVLKVFLDYLAIAASLVSADIVALAVKMVHQD
jgi:hypothetical protein